MNALEIEREFLRLCEVVSSQDTPESGVPELEPNLLRLLDFVNANLGEREILVRCFVALVDGSQPNQTSWIVRFCMRELRWPEVREAANRRFSLARGAEVPRLMNWLSDINWVYDDAPWEDGDFFRYFWNKEHPGEPWPCQV